MIWKLLFSALLTGSFCAAFAVCVDLLLPEFMGLEVAVIALISGFCGSIFANLVLSMRGAK